MKPSRWTGRRCAGRCLAAITALLLSLFALLPATAAAAQPAAGAGAPAPAAAAGEDETSAVSTPRASLSRFLDLSRAGRYADAAHFLDIPRAREAEGARLARRLKAVLDRHAWLDLARVSAEPLGDTHDGAGPGTDEITKVPGPGGAPEPVRLVHRMDKDGIRWVFTRATVDRIDGWYEHLPGRMVLEHIPEPLARPGPGELLYWQWIAAPIALALAWMLGRLLSFLTRAILGRIAARTSMKWDEALLERIGGPLTLGWMLASLYAALPYAGLYQPAEATVKRVLGAAALGAMFWGMLRAVGVITQMVADSTWAVAHPASRALIPLSGRAAKVVVVAIAGIAVISDLGYPVASLIAGLGVGGLAFALAAQKTVENLFGAFSLGIDQPFREGDFVKIEDFVGTVEAIGLRSTRVRTLDRTIVSLPNGKLADMRVESYSARDRLRLACTVGLVYGTKASQMREVLAGLERVLREHPKIWPDAVVVRFKELGSSSLDIEIMAWFLTADWGEFQAIRQELLLSFMDVVEKAGSSFAFPTRTVHLVKEPPAAV